MSIILRIRLLWNWVNLSVMVIKIYKSLLGQWVRLQIKSIGRQRLMSGWELND